MLNINPDRYGIGVNLWKISGLTDVGLEFRRVLFRSTEQYGLSRHEGQDR